jgi:hypothetical protein
MDPIAKVRSLTSDEDKLIFLESIQFETTFKKNGDDFVFYIPNLGVLGKGQTLDAAHLNLQANKTKYFNEMIYIDAADEILFPGSNQGSKSVSTMKVQGSSFSLYFPIRDALIVLFLVVGLSVGAGAIKKAVKKFNHKMSSNLKGKPAKLVERQQRFQTFLDGVKPYVIQYKKFQKDVESEL